MRILIISATVAEVFFLSDRQTIFSTTGSITSILNEKHSIDVLIAGIGSAHTAFHLGKQLEQKKYDFVLNIGLAGAIDKSLELGSVVQIEKDSFFDLGAQDKDDFLTVYDLGLAQKNDFPYREGKLIAMHNYQEILSCFPLVESITVNTVHGDSHAIAAMQKRTFAATESMEGAAVYYACLFNNVNCVQIRSISNYVEQRDKSKWNIPLALHQLENAVRYLIGNL